MKYFYRIGNQSTGLWYSQDGAFTGDIHSKFNWLNASQLEMPFDKELINYLSVADSLEHLYQWFSREEIFRLQENNFCIEEWQAFDFKHYHLYNHNVINKLTSKLTSKFILI